MFHGSNPSKRSYRGANILFSQRGGSKEPAKEEQVTIDFAFATVVSIADISKGDSFTKENLWVKRPGTGEILAAEYQNILGKKTNKFIPKNTHSKRRHHLTFMYDFILLGSMAS